MIALSMAQIVEFCDRWQVVEFVLFSSVLREDFRSDSDIDVMVQSAELVSRHIAQCFRDFLMADVQLQDAVIRRLLIIAEAARRVSDATRLALPEIAWSEINGMRNRLVHEYDDVNLNIVWAVVQNEIPTLISVLKSRIPPES